MAKHSVLMIALLGFLVVACGDKNSSGNNNGNYSNQLQSGQSVDVSGTFNLSQNSFQAGSNTYQIDANSSRMVIQNALNLAQSQNIPPITNGYGYAFKARVRMRSAFSGLGGGYYTNPYYNQNNSNMNQYQPSIVTIESMQIHR